MAERVLVDTSILISLYNKGDLTDRFLELNRKSDLFFSVVTINEFVRGAHDSVSKGLVDSFLTIVGEKLLTPTQDQWLECGRISERLLKAGRRSKEKVVLLQNDILIGLTARDHQALLITRDRKDFDFLKPLIRMLVEFW